VNVKGRVDNDIACHRNIAYSVGNCSRCSHTRMNNVVAWNLSAGVTHDWLLVCSFLYTAVIVLDTGRCDEAGADLASL